MQGTSDLQVDDELYHHWKTKMPWIVNVDLNWVANKQAYKKRKKK